MKYLESFRASFMFNLEEKFGDIRQPTNKPDPVRKQVDETGATGKTWKKSRGQRLEGGGETEGLMHCLVMNRNILKVSQGLIMSQINVAGSAVQSQGVS